MNVIEIHQLRKLYGRRRHAPVVALDDLDLEVPAGGVYGFLGPNGSGKTTTIRCLLGLAAPTAGSCRILGRDPRDGLTDVIDRIGSIIESPALFPGFTGRKNLELLAPIAGADKSRIDIVLETVDLADRQNDRVKTYSLGMRQRLAIAAALLKDPELLILDEPANGLDPAGIREVRELLRRLGSEGRTVLLSSHVLSEVQQTCDRVAILSRGRCVAQGAVHEVLARSGARGITARVESPEAAILALQFAGIAARQQQDKLHVDIDPAEGALVAKALADHGMYPSELTPARIDLETIFFELTEGEEVPA